MSSAILARIQKDLAALAESLGVEVSKTKMKVKDENAPKKEPNVWIKFTQRVSPLIAAQLKEQKAPATVGKQFCSFLKEQKAYDLWADEEIMAEFASWERPEVSKMEREKSAKASEASSDAEASVGSKVVKHQSEATKAAAAVKRAANKAKKLAEAESAEEEVKPKVKAVKAVKAVKPKEAKEPKAKEPKEYTMEQLADFDSFSHEGADYGRNARGDVVNGDGTFIGSWNGKTVNKKAPKPADWADVAAAM